MQKLAKGFWIYCRHSTLTWRSPSFVVAQLSTAVRATCVDATIMQQDECMLPSTCNLFQPPATEQMTVPRLKHGVPLHTNTQLPIFGVPPAQHGGGGRGNEHQYEEGRRNSTDEGRHWSSRLREIPLSPLHVNSNPGTNKSSSTINFFPVGKHPIVLYLWILTLFQ